MSKNLLIADLEAMNLGRRYWGATLDRLHPPDDSEFNYVKLVRGYAAKIPEMIEKGIGLLLWGANGRGKTYALSALAKEVARLEYSVFVVTADMLKDAQTSFKEEILIAGQSVIERSQHCDFLVIDDLGKEWRAASGFAEQMFENLIRRRTRAKKTTSVSTNMDPDTLKKTFGESAFSLVREMMLAMQVKGPEIRAKLLKGVGEELMKGQ